MLKVVFQYKGMEVKEGRVWRYFDRSDWVEVVIQVLEFKEQNVIGWGGVIVGFFWCCLNGSRGGFFGWFCDFFLGLFVESES